MGLAGSQDPGPPFLLLHAAWEQGLLTPWEPINRKQTPTWHLLLQLGPLITVPPTLPLPGPRISKSKTKDLKCMNNIKLRGILLEKKNKTKLKIHLETMRVYILNWQSQKHTL